MLGAWLLSPYRLAFLSTFAVIVVIYGRQQPFCQKPLHIDEEAAPRTHAPPCRYKSPQNNTAIPPGSVLGWKGRGPKATNTIALLFIIIIKKRRARRKRSHVYARYGKRVEACDFPPPSFPFPSLLCFWLSGHGQSFFFFFPGNQRFSSLSPIFSIPNFFISAFFFAESPSPQPKKDYNRIITSTPDRRAEPAAVAVVALLLCSFARPVS